MDLLSIPGNLQLMDRALPALGAGSQVAGAAESGFGFASLMKQSQVAVNQQSGGKAEKNISTEAVESPSVRGADNSQYKYLAKETPKVVNAVGKQNSERIFSDKLTEGSFLSSPDNSTAEVDTQAEKAVAPDEIMYSYVAVMAMLDGLALEEGTSTQESEISLLSQSAVEGQGVSGAGELQTREQLPLEWFVQQLSDSVSGNTGGKSASEIAAIISSVIHGGGDELIGSSVLSTAMEEPAASGSLELQTREQLPLEWLLQQLRDSASGNTAGKSASELAALIGSVIHGSGDEVVGTNGSAPVTENGNLISGFMDVVKNGDNGQNNVGVKNQTEVASFISNSRLESLAAKVSAGKNIVAAEQAAVTVTHTSKQQPGNLFSGNEASRSALKTVPGQLLAAAGEKAKSIGDQQPHENPGTPLGTTSGQKNTATKIIFSQSQGFLDQQSGGQKSKAGEILALGLSELSADENHNLRINMNAAGENQFSGLPLPGLESAVSKGENQLPITSDDLLNQVTTRLPDRHNSRQVVTIQLQPESLGKVEIKLVMEQQKLSAHFVVQHSEVRDVLLKHVTSLHDALVAKGLEVKQVAVEIAPAEKMTGMAVNIDQHAADGHPPRDFQQFSPGSEQRHHAFSAQQQGVVSLPASEEVPTSEILSSALSLKPGSLHIQA